jgi:hypothetical protein
MALIATWQSDGTRATLRDEDDGLWARLALVDDWYEPRRREPVRAWVVEWLDGNDDDSPMARTRLDVAAQPARDEDTMARLSEAGAAVARTTAPTEPEAFGHAETGHARGTGIYRRIQLVSHAIQEAQGRLNDAARVTEPWGAHRVLIALTEALAWVRALDDAMKHVWHGLSDELRADITTRIDEALLLRSAGMSREDLRGMCWLAGKLLHFGPLPAVELKQWREGQPPRWKWRPSREIFPVTRGERRSHDRLAYDRYLAGRDLIGTFNLFHALLAAEFLAWGLTGRPDA